MPQRDVDSKWRMFPEISANESFLKLLFSDYSQIVVILFYLFELKNARNNGFTLLTPNVDMKDRE